VFHNLLEKYPAITEKIKIMKGDILQKRLGLNEEDENELLSNVNVIFHCAANVRFDQPLKPMIQMNVAGTLKVINLAKKMMFLNVIVYVSTSYCQCNERVLEERAYSVPHNPFVILEMVEKLDENSLKKITPRYVVNINYFLKSYMMILISKTAKWPA